MIDKAQRVLLGRIVAAHGIRGDVVIDSYTAEPSDIAAYGPLSSADGGKQLDIKVVRVTPKGVVARVGGVADRNGAEALRGTDLYAPRARLPEAEEGEYYYADLAGLRAEDETGNRIGSVVGVQNYGAGDDCSKFASMGRASRSSLRSRTRSCRWSTLQRDASWW